MLDFYEQSSAVSTQSLRIVLDLLICEFNEYPWWFLRGFHPYVSDCRAITRLDLNWALLNEQINPLPLLPIPHSSLFYHLLVFLNLLCFTFLSLCLFCCLPTSINFFCSFSISCSFFRSCSISYCPCCVVMSPNSFLPSLNFPLPLLLSHSLSLSINSCLSDHLLISVKCS